MTELYPVFKSIHVAAVVASGTLFALRGMVMQAGARWAMAAPLRYLSYAIDTVLLSAAIVLVLLLPAAVYANGWLVLKILLLVVYIVFGSFALKRGRTARARRLCYVAALLVFGYIYAVARAHHPLGPLRLVQSWLS